MKEAVTTFSTEDNDIERLYRIQQLEAYFVLRAKDNLQFNGMYSNKVDKEAGVICDQIGTFTNQKSYDRYPEKLRRIKYYDSETNVEFVFLTNHLELSTYEIVQIPGITLLDKTPIKELLTNTDYKNVNELNCKQLLISLF